MNVRTCLLITDDPDDHIEFSEALHDLSDDTVVLSVSDMGKAIDLLRLKKCLPEFVFLNMDSPGIDPDIFFSALEGDESLQGVKVIAYGGSGPFVSSPRISLFLNGDMSYSELKQALRGML